mmetsp:Transcript_48255/g.77287  ORF Transcript_48255/g.77287 Transcript_48255/m.77287 type:complete len:95 (+) Transcript_48255:3-287(+)
MNLAQLNFHASSNYINPQLANMNSFNPPMNAQQYSNAFNQGMFVPPMMNAYSNNTNNTNNNNTNVTNLSHNTLPNTDLQYAQDDVPQTDTTFNS